jgi:hypothetical protein
VRQTDLDGAVINDGRPQRQQHGRHRRPRRPCLRPTDAVNQSQARERDQKRRGSDEQLVRQRITVGRPRPELQRGLEETERQAWCMRREGDHFFFGTRAGVNKRFFERFGEVQPSEIPQSLDNWVQEIYSGFGS